MKIYKYDYETIKSKFDKIDVILYYLKIYRVIRLGEHYYCKFNPYNPISFALGFLSALLIMPFRFASDMYEFFTKWRN